MNSNSSLPSNFDTKTMVQRDPSGNYYVVGEDGRISPISLDEGLTFVARKDVETFRWTGDEEAFEKGYRQWHVKFNEQ
jgi:hypothetical protein